MSDVSFHKLDLSPFFRPARLARLVLLICTLPSLGCSTSAQDNQSRGPGRHTKDSESTGLAKEAEGHSEGDSGSDERPASNGPTKAEVTRAKQVRRTKITIAFLQCDIERYHTILGVYPKTLEGLAKPPDDEASREKWEAAGSPRIVEILPDSWGRKIEYELREKDSYRVWSIGPDGRNSTNDDIIGGADNENVPSGKRPDIAKAKEQMQLLAYFVESYARDVGALPLSLGWLQTAPNDTKLASRWKGPYMKVKINTDPWGYLYNYFVVDDKHFIISSNGPDGLRQTRDDITSEELLFPKAK